MFRSPALDRWTRISGMYSLLLLASACAPATSVAFVEPPPQATETPDTQPDTTGDQYSAAKPTLTYFANEGVSMRHGHRVVVIDGLHRYYRPAYDVLPRTEQERLETAQDHYAQVDLILVTHHHRDHFHPEAVLRHLRSNANAQLLGPTQVVDELSHLQGFAEVAQRVQAVAWQPGQSRIYEFPEITVTALSLRHGGKAHVQIENVGYIVTMGEMSLAHFGDAEGTEHNLRAHKLAPKLIDAAVVPYWWLESDTGAAAVRRQIGSAQLFVAHIDPEDDRAGERVRERFPKAQLLETRLERWPLRAR